VRATAYGRHPEKPKLEYYDNKITGSFLPELYGLAGNACLFSCLERLAWD